MKRIGLLGMDERAEMILAEFFSLDPDAQVFLSREDSQRANPMAIRFPCWLLDDDRSVIDEADIILVHSASRGRNAQQETMRYRPTQLVIFYDVWPAFNSHIISPRTEEKMRFVNHHLAIQNVSPFSQMSTEQIDDYLFVVRAFLFAMKPTWTLDVNFQTSTGA